MSSSTGAANGSGKVKGSALECDIDDTDRVRSRLEEADFSGICGMCSDRRLPLTLLQ
jgi:hypothetical protein